MNFKQIPNPLADINFPAKLPLNPLDSLLNLVGAAPDRGSEYANLKALIEVSQTQIETSLMNNTMSVAKLDNFATSLTDDVLKNYPYVFSVVDVSNGGSNVIAQYRLPINPQELTIQTPFAIKTTVTSGGILEQHNGAPIKIITLNGTTGGVINRGVNTRSRYNGIFAGTVDAINQAVSAATALVSTQQPEANEDSIPIQNTGYYQMHILDMFLNSYAEVKKAAGNQGLRLVLSIPKDKVNYIVTPQTLLKRRSVQSPMEYIYSVQCLAWATIDLNNVDFSAKPVQGLKISDQDAFRNVLNKFRDLRNVISDFRNIITAVGGDIQNDIIDPANTIIYSAKDILGIPKTVADMTENLKSSAFASLAANWESLKTDFNNPYPTEDAIMATIRRENSDYIQNTTSTSFAESDPKNSINKDEVLSNTRLMDQINVTSLDLNQYQIDALDSQTAAAAQLTTNDFNKMITNLNSLYNSLEPLITQRDPMDEEWQLLYAIKDAVTSLGPLVANTEWNTSMQDDTYAQDPYLAKTALQFWQGVSEQNGIIFNKPEGKFSIPMPFKSSLEQIAFIYLGDPKRWTEIAALNNLQYPYVDEEGFVNKFLSNGAANQFTVGSATNLFVGQTIYLSSNTQLISRRKIQQIFQVAENNYIITVDGDPTLSNYKLVDNAQMKAYLPYTVNSLMSIFIPTSQVPSNQDTEETVPITFLKDDLDNIKFSKIDLLLDDNYDLAITQDGFANLAYGNTNLIQAAKIKLKTPQNSLMLHPNFGAGIEVGTSTADVDASTTLRKISRSFSADPRFKTPSSASVVMDGSTVTIDLVVPKNDGNGVIPITFPLMGK